MSTEKNQTAAPSLVGQLDTEYVQAAQGDRAQRVQELRAIAAKAQGAQALYDNSLILIVFFALVGIAASIFSLREFWRIAMHLNDPKLALSHDLKVWGAVFVFLGLLPLATAVMFWLRYKRPLCTFTEQGLISLDIAKPIPWTSIEHYEVLFGGSLAVILNVDLREDAEHPPVVKSRLRRAKYSRFNKRRLSFDVPGIRGMRRNKLAECFQTWWHAGLARAELAQMGED